MKSEIYKYIAMFTLGILMVGCSSQKTPETPPSPSMPTQATEAQPTPKATPVSTPTKTDDKDVNEIDSLLKDIDKEDLNDSEIEEVLK